MEQSKIAKVIELTDRRHEAKGNYDSLKKVLTEVKEHTYSNKGLVTGFFENLNDCYFVSRVEEVGTMDNFYRKVFETIQTEWDKICQKHLDVINEIDKELEEL